MATAKAQKPAGTTTSSSSKRPVFVLAGGVAAFLAVLYLVRSEVDLDAAVKSLEQLVAKSGYLGPVIFAAAYALATVLLVPASLLTLGAGYLFGPVLGTAVVSAASTTGATASFLISRYLARPVVAQWVAGNKRFGAVDKGVATDGAKLVFLLRLSPLLPFSLVNYGLGITQVKLSEYVVASWAGMLPATFAYVYLGSLGRLAVDVAAAGGGGGGGGGGGALGEGSSSTEDIVKIALYVVGGIATIWATRLVSSAASKALEEQEGT